jgi:hypothetical protein
LLLHLFNPSGSTSLTTRFNIPKILRCAHIEFMGFVQISEKTATSALYDI